MRLRDKVRRQSAEIKRLWKHVTFPKQVIKKGDMLCISVALSKEQISRSYSAEMIIDEELISIKRKILQALKGGE